MTDELAYVKAYDAFARAQVNVQEATKHATQAQIVLSNALNVKVQAERVLRACEKIALPVWIVQGNKMQAVSDE